MISKIKPQEARIDFSFKREVFFIIAGGIIGALVMAIPFTFPFTGRGSGYALTWIVFGHIVGVYSPIPLTIIAGILIHLLTGISIGIISGIFLYKTNILNISKPSNGLRYGLFVGALVYIIFAIPVGQFVLNPEFRHTLSNNGNFDIKIFDYKTRGMMASIGKRTGIGSLFGMIEVQGLLAWLIWRGYYLTNLPTLQKKIRVLADWTLDMFFKRDVTMLKTFVEEENEEKLRTKTSSSSI